MIWSSTALSSLRILGEEVGEAEEAKYLQWQVRDVRKEPQMRYPGSHDGPSRASLYE